MKTNKYIKEIIQLWFLQAILIGNFLIVTTYSCNKTRKFHCEFIIVAPDISSLCHLCHARLSHEFPLRYSLQIVRRKCSYLLDRRLLGMVIHPRSTLLMQLYSKPQFLFHPYLFRILITQFLQFLKHCTSTQVTVLNNKITRYRLCTKPGTVQGIQYSFLLIVQQNISDKTIS